MTATERPPSARRAARTNGATRIQAPIQTPIQTPTQAPDEWAVLLTGDPNTTRRSTPTVAHEAYHELPFTTPTSSFAVLSLMFGLGVFVTFGFSGFPAVLLGHFAWGETRTGERAGHGMTVAGLALGYAAIFAWVAAIVFFTTAGRNVQFPQFPTTSVNP